MTDLLHKRYTQTIARAIFQPCLGISITQKTNEVEKIRYVISTKECYLLLHPPSAFPCFKVDSIKDLGNMLKFKTMGP